MLLIPSIHELVLFTAAWISVTNPALSAEPDDDSGKARQALTLVGTDAPTKSESAVFSADGTRVALFQSGKRISVWDTGTGKSITAIDSPGFSNRHLFATTANGRSVFAWNAVNGACVAWDVHTGTARTVFKKPGDEKTTFGGCTGTVSADGARIATVHDGGGCATHIHVWDVRIGKELWNVNNDGGEEIVFAVAFSPDGERLAAGTQDGKIKLFDAATGKPTATLSDKGWIIGLAWSADGKRLAGIRRSARTNHVLVWDLATARVVGTVGPLADHALGAVLSPDGSQVAVLDRDNHDRTRLLIRTVRESPTGPNYLLPGALALSWTPDGKSIIVLREHGKYELLTFDAPDVRK